MKLCTLGLAATALVGFANDANGQMVAPAAAPAHLESVQMRRSACYGPCPVYSVEVLSDGRVIFNGEDHVQSSGLHESKITADDLAFLARAFDRMDFVHLRERYVSAADGCLQVWTDNPSVEIVLTSNGNRKRVTYYYGCKGLPVTKRIDWLSKTIDEVAGTGTWIGQPEPIARPPRDGGGAPKDH